MREDPRLALSILKYATLACALNPISHYLSEAPQIVRTRRDYDERRPARRNAVNLAPPRAGPLR
eukprot:scaffold125861_cov21-Phaeocystis_antarctica.AAC.1